MPLDLPAALAQTSLIQSTSPSADEIAAELERRIASGRRLNAMYGETYDRLGPTLDSLKYYFAVATFGRVLRDAGAEATPTILIADVATTRNEPESAQAELMELGRQSKAHVQRVSDAWSLGLNVLLMSEYLDGDEFQSRLKAIRDAAGQREEIFQYVRQTVPESKIAEEEQKDFAYAFEEIATIIEYDLKIGPPREQFYDDPTRTIARELGRHPLLSVYLHPTYPLGVGFDFFFANPEIECYGVTAYKAGSKNLEGHRIVLGRTSRERIDQLIDASFVGKKPAIPNPVLDLGTICEQARQWRTGEFAPLALREEFYAGKVKPGELQERVKQSVREEILDVVSG